MAKDVKTQNPKTENRNPNDGLPATRTVETVARERLTVQLAVDLVKSPERRAVTQKLRVDVDFSAEDGETLLQLGDALIAHGVIEPGYQRQMPGPAALKWLVRQLTMQRMEAR